MLKKIIITITILCGTTILVSAQSQAKTKVKIEYDFPKEMSENTRKAFFEQSEKGRILYENNCAVCHNIKVKRKSYVPDFQPGQLSGYVLRALNPMHENGLPEEKITAEDLGNIMTFLTYKSKNNLGKKKK